MWYITLPNITVRYVDINVLHYGIKGHLCWYMMFLGQLILSWSAYHNFLSTYEFSTLLKGHWNWFWGTWSQFTYYFTKVHIYIILSTTPSSCKYVSFKYWISLFHILLIKLAFSVNCLWMKMKSLLKMKIFCSGDNIESHSFVFR